MPYLVRHPSDVYYAQRKVVERLQEAVARVLKTGRTRQAYLKRSLGTKVLSQANVTIKPVLIEFDRIIRDAEALENSKPPARATLSAAEIDRMAEYVYGNIYDLYKVRFRQPLAGGSAGRRLGGAWAQLFVYRWLA